MLGHHLRALGQGFLVALQFLLLVDVLIAWLEGCLLRLVFLLQLLLFEEAWAGLVLSGCIGGSNSVRRSQTLTDVLDQGHRLIEHVTRLVPRALGL